MTCVLTAPLPPLAPPLAPFKWSPMTTLADVSPHGALGALSQNYVTSGGSGMKKGVSGAVSKRASRAGTRSVSTLSAAQLERKRANDREAQRAIRQRTKDHIDGLEKQIGDIKQVLNDREKLMRAVRHRNDELEEENSFLRLRMNEAGLPVNISKVSSAQDSALLSATLPSVSDIQRADSTPAAGRLSITTGPSSSNANNGSWQQQQQQHQQQQQQQTAYSPTTNGSLVPTSASDVGPRNMTGWRARESPSVSSSVTTGDAQQPVNPSQGLSYNATTPTERQTWTAVPSHYDFAVTGQQSAHSYQQSQTPHAAQESQYQQPTGVQTYSNGPPPPPPPPSQQQQAQQQQQPQTAPHPPLLAPQSDFQPMSNAAFYHHFSPHAQNYPTHAHFQTTPTQVQSTNSAFPSSQAQIQPSPASATSYHSGNDATFLPPHIHPPMIYREVAELRGYAMDHYPSG